MIGGKASELCLRENKLAVHFDLEAAAAAFDALDLRIGKGGQDLSGQTGRLRGVVSLQAEFDGYVHGRRDSPMLRTNLAFDGQKRDAGR